MTKRCKWCHQDTDTEQKSRDLRFELEEARTALRSANELLTEHQDYMQKRGIWDDFLGSLSPQPSTNSIAIANVARSAKQ